MIVFLNGKLVPEPEATVPVFDRSFLYGDGVFESLRVSQGQPFRWAQHLRRLEDGAAGLHIDPPFPADELRNAVDRLVDANALPEAVLRITLSRGVGARGYSPRGATNPTVVMSLHPLPEAAGRSDLRWALATSRFRLPPDDPLSRWKTANKLLQVLARAEAEQAGADEALLLNARGELCETSSGNLFWVEGNRILTPPVQAGLLPGITRAVVLELAPAVGLLPAEESGTARRLAQSDGAFVTLSSLGVVEVGAVDGQRLRSSPHTAGLRMAYQERLAQECATGSP
ncbi:MAG: aminodeoxychorismate lyase [Verrucomicrobia bacterium]|jgi:aminodeoxychorismate lyase|nr:aminodeoxychorismate lyase [Verrucomicrobiota bacterium]